LFALFLLGVCAHAAVVEGVVLDEETGNPLARTLVSLIPLPGTLADTTPVRTGARGSFVILSVRPGWYVLRATRRGYAPTESGQLRPGRPGHAFEVADDRASGFHEIHMSHLPAVTGAVLDENGIGIPRWTVHIYTAQKPIRHVGQSETDDRGNYRIGELDPGSYLLRSGPGPLEDQTPVVATYSKTAVELFDAVPVSVHVGETLRDVTIRPVKGRLLTLSGTLLPVPDHGAILTLVTDTGRREVVTASGQPTPFAASGVQPGPVELIVKGIDERGNECGSYARLSVDKDVTGLRLACAPLGPDSFTITGATVKSPVLIRRVDLDGAGESHALARDELLAAGHWEISVPPGDYYVASVRSSGTPAAHNGAWWGFDAGNYTRLAVMLSSSPATIAGVVSTSGNPVAGAPVFVQSAGGAQTWTARSNPQGNYSVGGLAPGTYNIVSGFDLDLNDPAAAPKFDIVSASEGNTTTHALEMILP
jgi:hypothetical protein